MFPRTLKTDIARNVDINTQLQNLNTSVASFPHRDIHHQSNEIEIKLYKITYTRFFIKKNFICRNLSCWKTDYTVIYHKYDYHDNFFTAFIMVPHLSFLLFYNKYGTPWSPMGGITLHINFYLGMYLVWFGQRAILKTYRISGVFFLIG